MIILQIIRPLTIVFIVLISLIIFIYADSRKKGSEITLESEAVIKNPIDANGLLGYLALPFKKLGAFFKKMMYSEPPNSWGYVHNNIAVFAYKGEKEYMEDRFFIDENFENTGVSVYAIFDGHEGDFSAQYAIDNLMKSLEKKIIQLKKNPNSDENLKEKYMENDTIKYIDLLKDEIKAFDEKLLNILKIQKIQQILRNQRRDIKEYTREDGNIDEEKLKNDGIIKNGEELKEKPYLSGATASIALIDKNQLFITIIGSKPLTMAISRDENNKSATNKDERTKSEQTGELKQMEQSNQTGQSEMTGQLEGTEQSNQAMETLENELPRSLGDLEEKLPEENEAISSIAQYDLVKTKSEYLILASSGLWNTFTDGNEVVTFIEKSINNNEKFFGANNIVFEAEKRGHKRKPPIKTDNITVIILKTYNARVFKLLNE